MAEPRASWQISNIRDSTAEYCHKNEVIRIVKMRLCISKFAIFYDGDIVYGYTKLPAFKKVFAGQVLRLRPPSQHSKAYPLNKKFVVCEDDEFKMLTDYTAINIGT